MGILDRIFRHGDVTIQSDGVVLREHFNTGEVPSSATASGAEATPSSGLEPHGEDHEMQDILEKLHSIGDVIGHSDEKAGTSHPAVLEIRLPMRDVLHFLPKHIKAADASIPDEQILVPIAVPEAAAQLRRGKIQVAAADLVFSIPDELLAPDYRDHLSEMVTVPLPLIVGLISADFIEQGTSSAAATGSTLDHIPDLFSQGSGKAHEKSSAALQSPTAPETPAAWPSRPEPAAPAAPPAVATPAPVRTPRAVAPQTPAGGITVPPPLPKVTAPAARSAPAPTPAAPAKPVVVAVAKPSVPSDAPIAVAAHGPEAEVPAAPRIAINNVNINSALPKEMQAHLKGVGRVLAHRIVAHRPYATLNDLLRVPGVSPGLFRQMTGEVPPPWVPVGGLVEQLLATVSGEGAPSLERVLERAVQQLKLYGCIISHADGYPLASAWMATSQPAVGAIAPQIFKQLSRYFELLKMDAPGSLTLYTHPRPVFITRHRDFFLIAFLSRGRCTSRRFADLERLNVALTARFAEKLGDSAGGGV